MQDVGGVAGKNHRGEERSGWWNTSRNVTSVDTCVQTSVSKGDAHERKPIEPTAGGKDVPEVKARKTRRSVPPAAAVGLPLVL